VTSDDSGGNVLRAVEGARYRACVPLLAPLHDVGKAGSVVQHTCGEGGTPGGEKQASLKKKVTPGINAVVHENGSGLWE